MVKARQGKRVNTYQFHVLLARGGQSCKCRLVLLHPGMHTRIRPCCVVLIEVTLEDVLRVKLSGSLGIVHRGCLLYVSMKGTLVCFLLRTTYESVKILCVRILQRAFDNNVVLCELDVFHELGQGTPVVRSGTSTCTSDGRNRVGGIELITVPEPNTFVSAVLGECSDEPDLQAEKDQQERGLHDRERQLIVSSPEGSFG